jgi:hypothetical protein
MATPAQDEIDRDRIGAGGAGVLFYVATLVRLGGNVMNRPL